jgi:protease IV
MQARMISFIKSVIKKTFILFLAMALATALFAVLVFAVLYSIGAHSKVSVPQSAVLVLKMDVEVPDAPLDEGSFAPLLGSTSLPSRVSLLSLIDAIDDAAADGRIKAILLLGAGPDLPDTGLSSVAELRAAIARFRETGKPVYAYVEDTGLRDYALACSAREVWMQPLCSLGLEGFAMEKLYFGAAFAKYGINVQTASAGKYKSAPDTFASDHMRPEDREQTEAFLCDAWTSCREMISQSRKVPSQKLEDLSQSRGVITAEAALEAKLVDRVAYRDELDRELENLVGKDKDGETFSQIDLQDYMNDESSPKISSELSVKSRPTVAVEYVEGEIVNGEGAWNEAGADRIVADLRSLRADKNVKAVVLRVNSPGGDAIAAEKIRREVELLAAKCPLVVSMGRMAASGGYWVSAPAKFIYAEPSTLTGSIGVFSLFIDVEKLSGDWGVNAESVGTSPFANMYSVFEHKDERQMALARGMVDGIYDQFLHIVAKGRDMDVDHVSMIAQGHIWSGLAANRNGLADGIGGLDEAITRAADLANLGDNYEVEDIPVSLSLGDALGALLGTHAQAANTPATRVLENLNRMSAEVERTNVFARLPFFTTGRF